MEKFSVPKELVSETIKALETVRNTGKLKKGVNETTKAVERGQAKLVLIAENVVPPEIVAHLPVLCDEKKIPWIIVPDKKELGIAAGLTIPTSSVAVLDEGEAKGAISGIIKKIETLRQNK